MKKHIVVFSTCANRREGEKIARTLVKGRLAACVNLVPVSSVYRWKGKIVKGSECLLIIKTKAKLFARLRSRILGVTSYEIPEIISLNIEDGLPSYLQWISEEMRSA
jgi:periplasmic divalent cation tolerance protein